MHVSKCVNLHTTFSNLSQFHFSSEETPLSLQCKMTAQEKEYNATDANDDDMARKD